MDKARFRERLIPLLFAAAGTMVYISLVFDHNVWLDEAFSASIIRCGFHDMLQRTFSDTLPPFYNVAAWCFTRLFGYSTLSLKLFSVIPMAALMLMAACLLTEKDDSASACVYIALATFMPHILNHGVEIRMYSWALFFAAASAICFYCIIKARPRFMIPLVVFTVLGAYTHQFALMAEALVWLMLLVFCIKEKKLPLWWGGALSCFLLYIPCALLTLRQMKKASSYFEASGGGLSGLLSALRYPFVTDITPISALLALAVTALFVYAFIRKDFLSLCFMGIYAIISFISYGIMALTGSTFFSARYLMPAIGILWLGAALAVGPLMKKRPARILCILITAAVAVPVYAGEYREASVDTAAFEAFIDSTGEG